MKDEFNLRLVKLLATGMTQAEIEIYLKQKGYTPNSLSIIEKRLRQIKKEYHAKTNFHLAIILKNKKIL